MYVEMFGSATEICGESYLTMKDMFVIWEYSGRMVW